jgi:cellulose 1,4-beta-cellobiosidase
MRSATARGAPRKGLLRALAGAVALASVSFFAVDSTVSAAPAPRVDNPYAGAGVYVNPEWSANAAAEPGGSRVQTSQLAFGWIESRPSTG